MHLVLRWLLNTLALFVVAFVCRPHFLYRDWITLGRVAGDESNRDCCTAAGLVG